MAICLWSVGLGNKQLKGFVLEYVKKNPFFKVPCACRCYNKCDFSLHFSECILKKKCFIFSPIIMKRKEKKKKRQVVHTTKPLATGFSKIRPIQGRALAPIKP